MKIHSTLTTHVYVHTQVKDVKEEGAFNGMKLHKMFKKNKNRQNILGQVSMIRTLSDK